MPFRMTCAPTLLCVELYPTQGSIGRALGGVGPSAAADVIAAAEARRTHVQRHGRTVVGRVGATT